MITGSETDAVSMGVAAPAPPAKTAETAAAAANMQMRFI
jgi:hypothetical protein